MLILDTLVCRSSANVAVVKDVEILTQEVQEHTVNNIMFSERLSIG